MAIPYNYSSQIRRIVTHFMRVFSGFQIKTSPDANGNSTFIKVPVMWGDADRQALNAIKQNSENTLITAPMISCYITSMDLARDRAGYQGNQDTLLASERKFNSETGKYESTQGNTYQIDRLMFNPLNLGMTVDILTTNTEQKCQLFEQIYLIFNPAFEMQITDNPLHYTPIKRVELQDMTWDVQGVPKGTQDDPKVLRLTFKIEADIAPPAKVKRQTVIQSVIEQIGFGSTFDDILGWGDTDVVYNITTPGDHAISVSGNELTLLGPRKNLKDDNGNIYSWAQLIDQYGELKNGFSKISLRWNGDINNNMVDIFGYVNYTNIDNILSFTVDPATVPHTTLANVDKIINPHTQTPGNNLPVAALGQRYILTDDIGSVTLDWGNLTASRNDIIQFDGVNWNIVYDASTSITTDFVKDNSTQLLYMLVNGAWVDFINTFYLAGFWRIFI